MEQPTIASREDILATDDIERELVFVNAWKKHVFVRGFTADEAYRFRLISSDPTDKRNVNVMALVLCTTDAAGKAIFTEADTTVLEKRSQRAVDQISDVITRLSGMTAEARAELGKASAATDGAASSSV